MASILKTSWVWLRWSFCSEMAGLCPPGPTSSLLFRGLLEAIRHRSGKTGLATLCAPLHPRGCLPQRFSHQPALVLAENKPAGNGTGCLRGVCACVCVCVCRCAYLYVCWCMCVHTCVCLYTCLCVHACEPVYRLEIGRASCRERV